MKLAIVIFCTLLLFVLLQVSFLVHVVPKGFVPNLAVLLVVVLSVWEKPDSVGSFAAALFGGFFLDMFSGTMIGFWPLVLLAVSFTIKVIEKQYVRLPIPKKF